MKKEIKVLMLEDSPDDAELIRHELHKTEFSIVSHRVETKDSFYDAIHQFQPQVILSDYHLPSFDGLSALAMARKECPLTPFIFVSGTMGEESAIEALRNGATDYVLKDRLSRLVPCLDRSLKELFERQALREIETRLQQTEARFRAFMDHNPAMAFLKSKEGFYIYANRQFEGHFNLTKKDWAGKRDFDFWPEAIAKRMLENDQIVLRENRLVESTEAFFSPDGKRYYWMIFEFPVEHGPKRLIGGMAVDITAQKNIEEQLKASVDELGRLNVQLDRTNEALKKLDQLKSDFISTVSHELRTPMTIIRESISQIIDRMYGELTPLQEKRLNVTLKNIDRLKHIVDNLLDVSKYESDRIELHKENVDFVQLVREIIFSFEPQFKNKEIELQGHFSGNSIQGNADRDMLTQVLFNLISNALKFTDKGQVLVSVREDEQQIECSVNDSGRGIPEEELPKVFDKFQQFGRQEGPGEKGTGLGLTICKEIIKLHHGEIWVKSRPGGGSTFTFTLPKFTLERLFLEDLTVHLNSVFQRKQHFSILVFEINNFYMIQRELGMEKKNVMEKEFVRLIKQCMRRHADRIIYNGRFILITLPETNKDHALIISGRIQQAMDDLLLKENLKSKIEMTAKAAEYPNDGKDVQALLEKIGFIIMEDL